MARHIDLAAGDRVVVGGATISVVHKAGRRTRVSIDAPRDIEITHIQQPRDQEAQKNGVDSDELMSTPKPAHRS